VDTVFSRETVEFLQSGCGLLVAAVSADGTPRANRGWGLDVLADERVRVLLDADEQTTLEYLAEHDRIAINATSVPTYRSIQLKGRCIGVDAANDADAARARRYCDEFLAEVVAVDGYDLAILQRLVPASFVACTVQVEELYDQTPGPAAGASITLRPA
jgi:hypothetical protein